MSRARSLGVQSNNDNDNDKYFMLLLLLLLLLAVVVVLLLSLLVDCYCIRDYYCHFFDRCARHCYCACNCCGPVYLQL